MQNIEIQRYQRGSVSKAPRVGEQWQGAIEPQDRSWIVFVSRDGKPLVFLNRDPDTGAVLD